MSRAQLPAAVREPLLYARRIGGNTHVAVPAIVGTGREARVSRRVFRTVCGDTLEGDRIEHAAISPDTARRYWRRRVCSICDGITAEQHAAAAIKRVACW